MNEKLIILGKASVNTAEKKQCLALILKKKKDHSRKRCMAKRIKAEEWSKQR